MLHIKSSLLTLMTFSLFLVSCKEKEKNQTTDSKNDKEQTIVADPPKEESKEGMTIADAKKFLKENEANAGKEVTVTGYVWSVNNRTDGLVQLNIGDKKLEGMQAASFYCLFYESMAPKLKALGKDAVVTVTGLIGDGTGGVELSDCKLAE